MSQNTLTRRDFVAAGAACAAIAGTAGAISFTAQGMAFGTDDVPASASQKVTLCDGCGNKCAYTAYTVDGKLWRGIGCAGYPTSRGYLCGRGQGYAFLYANENRIKAPLKSNGNGGFDEISWDQACQEIGQKLAGTAPEKIALYQSRGNSTFYPKRLMAALGSANCYSDAAIRDAGITATIEGVSGAYPVPDVAHAKYIVMLDKSTYDGMRPSEMTEFSEMMEAGGHVVLVDSRETSFGRICDEWVGVKPGTELAFLLGVAGELVRSGHYSKAFTDAYANGFDQFAAEMRGYTLDWAASITGAEATKIAQVANDLWNNAPAAFVDMPWAGTLGSGFANSADTVRMIYLINAMLGSFNQKGGWLFPNAPYVSDEMLAEKGIPQLTAKANIVTYMDAPLVWGDSIIAAFEQMKAGNITQLIVVEGNPVLDVSNGNGVKEALSGLDLLVVMDSFMTDTAVLADYVLPLSTYLERTDTIVTASGANTVAGLRTPVLENTEVDAKSIPDAVYALAAGAGVADAFPFTLEDYNRANAELMGVSYEGLLQEGISAVPNSDAQLGTMPYLRTASGKVDFASPAFEAAGLSAVPTWTAPGIEEVNGSLRLMVGQEVVFQDTFCNASPYLMTLADKYQLQQAWVNTDTAAAAGIADGDTVEITSPLASIKVPVKVTDLIAPNVVWMPAHFGSIYGQKQGEKLFGAAPKPLIAWQLAPGTGAGMMNETAVTLKKAGA